MMSIVAAESYPRTQPEDRARWRDWLAEHHAGSRGVWLVTFKQSSGRALIDYDASVQEALCFGWVDSLGRGLDDERTMLLFTPRRPESRWSRPNKERIERLLQAGLMEPAGLALVEQAKANGAWTALDEVWALVVPDDLAEAFSARPGAAEHCDGFPPSIRRGILEWILDAKRPATRTRRIEETASRAAKGERANQWR